MRPLAHIPDPRPDGMVSSDAHRFQSAARRPAHIARDQPTGEQIAKLPALWIPIATGRSPDRGGQSRGPDPRGSTSPVRLKPQDRRTEYSRYG